jgi:hypothetical protein
LSHFRGIITSLFTEKPDFNFHIGSLSSLCCEDFVLLLLFWAVHQGHQADMDSTLLLDSYARVFALACGLIVLISVLKRVWTAYKPGLRALPGPVAARFTNAWRVMLVWSGNTHEEYRKLHAEYGPIVRTAPNVVDISDPSVISVIYGINSKYLKVRSSLCVFVGMMGLRRTSPSSTRHSV